MKEHFLSIIIISTILFFSSVYCDAGDACTNRTNTDCSTCINAGNCAFCKSSKKCVLYDPLNPPCGTSDMQYQTCVGRLITINFLDIWMIEKKTTFCIWEKCLKVYVDLNGGWLNIIVGWEEIHLVFFFVFNWNF